MDLIDRKALLERMNEFAAFSVSYKPYMSKDDIVESVLKQAKETALRLVEEAPIVKAIPFDSEYIKQILWERNIALQQLAEIGCGFGQDMTDIKKKIEAAPVVHGMEILNRLEHETFSAEVYNDDFDGVEIKNLLCLGDVAEVLDEMGLLDGKEKKHETN